MNFGKSFRKYIAEVLRYTTEISNFDDETRLQNVKSGKHVFSKVCNIMKHSHSLASSSTSCNVSVNHSVSAENSPVAMSIQSSFKISYHNTSAIEMTIKTIALIKSGNHVSANFECPIGVEISTSLPMVTFFDNTNNNKKCFHYCTILGNFNFERLKKIDASSSDIIGVQVTLLQDISGQSDILGCVQNSMLSLNVKHVKNFPLS